MANRFIYTQDLTAYEKLKEVGFEDLGCVESVHPTTYLLGNPEGRKIPEEYISHCWQTNRLLYGVMQDGC